MILSATNPSFRIAILGVALSLLGFSATAQAIVVAYYDFPVSEGTTMPSASNDSDPNTTASGLSIGPGNTGGISSVSFDHLFMRPVNNSTEAFAFSGNRYFTFTVTPGADPLSFTSLDFDYQLTTAGGEFYALYASPTVGGFTSGVNVATGTLTPGSPGFLNASVDLSGVASLQKVTTDMIFRVYVWGATAATDVTRFDNITMNAVPETGVAGLLGLSGLGLLVVRRRKSNKTN